MADKMQDDALRRLKQMYSKAPYDTQNTTTVPPQNSHSGKSVNSTESQADFAQNPSSDPEQGEKEHSTKPVHNSSSNILDVFMKDKEKSLIILLIVILISEKADTTLILALMYLVI